MRRYNVYIAFNGSDAPSLEWDEATDGNVVLVRDVVAKLKDLKERHSERKFSRDPEVFQTGYLLALDEVLRLLGE